jgi:outer membrane protein assembly factor BamB
MFFGGYVFVRSVKNGINYVNALDPYTSALVYQIANPGTGAPAKIDDEHFELTIPANRGGGWEIFNAKTGSWVTNTTDAPSGTIVPEYQVTRQSGDGTNTTIRWVAAFDISNIITTGKAPLKWNVSVGSAISALAIGDGMFFYGSWYDTRIFALNITDGSMVWETYTGSTTRDAIYYNGKLYHHGLARGIRTYNGTTGELVWQWDGGFRTYFSNTGTAGDGMFFGLGIDSPRGFLGAWDDQTGELKWKLEGAYYIGYLSPVYDDGKVYTVLFDGVGLSSMGLTEVPKKSVCVDANTGQIIWEMPFNVGTSTGGGVAAAGSFRSDVAIAYGILFFENNRVLYAISDLKPKDWEYYRGNYNLPGVTQDGPGQNTYLKWRFKTNGPITSSPIVINGTVYIGSQDKNYYAIDAYTGEKIWNFSTKLRVLSTPAVSGGKLYTGADDGNIYALDAKTGAVVWSKDVGGRWQGLLDYGVLPTNQPRSSPVIIGNRLYVGALDGKVYSVDTSSGNILWSYQTLGPILGSPAYYNGAVYIASTDINIGPNGTLYALNADTGTVLWASQVPQSGGSGTGSSTRDSPASSPIVVVGARSNSSANAKVFDMILIGNNGGEYGAKYVVGYNLDGTQARFPNGTLYRLFSLEGTGGSVQTLTPTYYNGTVYGASYLRGVAWNITDGKVLWERWLIHNTYSSPAVSATVEGTKVYIGGDSGSVHILDGATGKVFYSYHTTGVVASSPSIWNGKMYVGSGDGYVYAFDDKKVLPMSVTVNSDKTGQIENGEAITFSGRLNTTQRFYVPAEPTIGTGEIDEWYYPGIPVAKITVSLTGPNLASVDLTATTDRNGYYNVSYNPTVAGTWNWQAEYQGQEFPGDSFSYSSAQSETGSVEVLVPPTPTPTATPSAEVPSEYTYVAVAVILVAIVAIGIYAYSRRRKK